MDQDRVQHWQQSGAPETWQGDVTSKRQQELTPAESCSEDPAAPQQEDARAELQEPGNLSGEFLLCV